ncbi:hypothetical protein FRC11_006327 [Ceratobasidium sp. 423]|nr:hypothetical protein FRC11_006327 [Ceratobasidium sp. 423]
MKSLVALLDRKKKDRANTLIQVPFPSTLSHSAVHPDGPTSMHGARRTSTPSSFLRPPPQHRAASDSHTHSPPLSEPSPYYQGHPLVHSTSYYTDSDDGTFVDPFAPSPTKLDLASKPHHDLSQVYPRRGSEPGSKGSLAPSSYLLQPSREMSVLAIGGSQSQSRVAASAGKKGRWLRERRSLTSLLRPQRPNNPAEPVPAVPSLPSRVPERNPSSFFTRARSGSTPSATQTTERAHTTCQPSIRLGLSQLPTSTNPQPQAVDTEFKSGRYRGSVPLTLIAHSQANSSDSWVRVGRAGRDPGLPASPTTRRRAVSVPLPLPQPTKPLPLPPVPDVQRPQYAHKVDRSTAAPPEPVLMRYPGTSTECRTRPGHNAHGIKSVSVSVSTPARSNTGTRPSGQGQRTPQHGKQSSVGTAEGLVLKSALKHRMIEPAQSHPTLPVQPIKPLRICKREGVASKRGLSQLPTPSSEGSLKSLHYASVGHLDGAWPTIQHNKSNSGSSSGRECPGNLDEVPVSPQSTSTMERPVTSSTTTGSFGSIMRGHGLSSSDSRSLPVLDNIWGSFVSETAFGGSLPPSPVTSISAGYRATQPQEAKGRERIKHNPVDPGTDTSASSPHSESHWKPGSAPPSSPPVADLPPVPEPPPALSLSLSRAPRRKRSRSSANAILLLTPPTSPTEKVEFQGLDRAVTTSTSADRPPSRSGNKHSALRQQLGPRLARSASSPSIRPPVSPEIGYNPINTRSLDAVSHLSAQHQNSQSIPPSSGSQPSSQCTLVLGTPVAVPPSAVNLTSYLGTSSGSLVASGPNVRVHREGSGYAESPQRSAIGISIQVPGTASGGISDAIPGKFPPVPSDRIWSHEEEKTSGVVKNQDIMEGDLHEEPLLTPPVTPAWAVHVFNVDAEDNLQFGGMEHDAPSDRIPLARSGNLAQMRRQKRGDMRSASTQFPAEYSRGPDMTLPGPKKTDTRGNKASKSAADLARDVF